MRDDGAQVPSQLMDLIKLRASYTIYRPRCIGGQHHQDEWASYCVEFNPGDWEIIKLHRRQTALARAHLNNAINEGCVPPARC